MQIKAPLPRFERVNGMFATLLESRVGGQKSKMTRFIHRAQTRSSVAHFAAAALASGSNLRRLLRHISRSLHFVRMCVRLLAQYLTTGN